MKEKEKYINPWVYEDKIFTDEQIGKSFGFVYLITNKLDGRKYIGKKFFSSSKILKETKGTLNNPARKRRKTRVMSDWKNYYGSSQTVKDDVKELGKDNFSREILHLCVSTSHCSYLETKEIFMRDAILRDDYYNEWVTCKITQSHTGRYRIEC